MSKRVLFDITEESLANAKLIAAAPDLLEALQFCLENMIIMPMRCGEIAEAAIKKATE